MTDHIVEANKKVIDLDALEKLADEATPGPWTLKTGQTSYPECDDADSWSAVLTPRGREVVTLYERYGIKGEDRSDYDDDAAFIAAANPATMKALISELREARGLLSESADLTGLCTTPDRFSECGTGEVFLRMTAHNAKARAFLARNGKGEG